MSSLSRHIQRQPSKSVGRATEIAVLAPIRAGRVPGERRTFEERLRFVIQSIEKRAAMGLPTLLNRVQSIHVGRLLIIRPEHYLHYSDVPGVRYVDAQPGPAEQKSFGAGRKAAKDDVDAGPTHRVPAPLDDYRETDIGSKVGKANEAAAAPAPHFRSFLMTIVTFDGDLKPYFRDVADFLGKDFDRVFENCEDFDTTGDFQTFWAWVRRYQISVDFFHSAYGELSVAHIKWLQDFKRRFDAFVASVRSPDGRHNRNLDELFDDFLRETQQYASDFPGPGGIYKYKED